MIFKRIIIIKKKQAAIITALSLLILLGIIGAKLANRSAEPVLSYAVANRVIVVDPGHGGFDPGAIGKHSLEKDVTLAISHKLEKYLSQAGALVIVLRDKDDDLAGDNFKGSTRERKRKDLAERVARAHQNRADLYISIHTNADPSPRWYGAQTFYNKKSEESKKLAMAIQKELVQVLHNTHRQAKEGSFYIINETKMPAVIVEVGFLSNPREEQLLNNSDYQSKVAYAIFSGIAKAQQDSAATPTTSIEGD